MKLSGTKLRTARKAAGLRVEDVAVATGISYATIIRAETGANTPSAEKLRLIASALGVSMESLFDEEAPVGGGR
jgi:transcriptional regulator with XRE-family HTH domain